MITITFEGSGLEKKILRMEGRIKNLRPFLKQAGDYLVKRTRKDFEDGGNPKWQENAFRTPVLLKSRKLMDSVRILSTDENSVTVGTDSQNRHHNFGYDYLPTAGQRRWFFAHLKGSYIKNFKSVKPGYFVNPKRQFMKFQPEDEAYLSEKLSQYIVKD